MYTVTLIIGNHELSKASYIQAEGRQISGYVYGGDTAQRLSGYFVELQRNGKIVSSTLTDANGKYLFQSLPASGNQILIEVSAFSSNLMSGTSSMTDENGQYTLSGLDTDSIYLVSIWYEAYQGEFYYLYSD